ncbi:MAG: ribosomal protein S18-alanine N-acetyltransferase [Actinobacteria bacterium]|nr:ribosomal protein S18-alanine N-acetyltransferase [Actinomycetota bacterium]
MTEPTLHVAEGTYTLRDMRESDLPHVLGIERASFPVPWTAQMFRDEFDHARSWRRVVEDETGSVVGFLVARFYGDSWHIMDLVITFRQRRRGLGGLLLDDLLQTLPIDATLVLEVRRGNEAAIALYSSRGFRTVGVRRGYYPNTGEDALVMMHGAGT